MSSGYQDWHSLTFLQEQSAAMYFADVFRLLSEDPVVSDKKVIDSGATYYAWNSFTVNSPGRIICLGSIVLLGDL